MSKGLVLVVQRGSATLLATTSPDRLELRAGQATGAFERRHEPVLVLPLGEVALRLGISRTETLLSNMANASPAD